MVNKVKNNFAKSGYKSCYLSITVPVYNEEDNVEILYKEIHDKINLYGKPYEVIFVDDGSSDFTIQRLSKIIQKEKSSEKKIGKTRLIVF